MNENHTTLAVAFTDENYDPRCPCLLVLDTSGSMHGEPIKELNQGLRRFRDELCEDPLAARRVEVGMITFGGSARMVQDFVTASAFTPPVLEASGGTPMGAALELALDRLLRRKQDLKNDGIPYYQPWLFLVTDGAPTDAWREAAAAVQAEGSKDKNSKATDKGINVFVVGVEGADMQTLAQVAPPNRPPLKLKGLQFADMFVWISQSLGQVTNSNPGDKVGLQTPIGDSGWGELSA
ncbi:MAG: VWA domain-containing protein [bacterium]|nr:VWA domain-containing protein [bacterium]